MDTTSCSQDFNKYVNDEHWAAGCKAVWKSKGVAPDKRRDLTNSTNADLQMTNEGNWRSGNRWGIDNWRMNIKQSLTKLVSSWEYQQQISFDTPIQSADQHQWAHRNKNQPPVSAKLDTNGNGLQRNINRAQCELCLVNVVKFTMWMLDFLPKDCQPF